MTSEGAPIQAEEVLANPVILRGAWLRVNSWYGRGEFAPQPELSQWLLYPEAKLRELALDLRKGTWRPESWRQVPYPKKGARLRHYLMPTVRDQVAFMAHMVALGPILDHQIADFAFGNRWHRPIGWQHRGLRHGWVNRAYPVLSHRIYLPYCGANLDLSEISAFVCIRTLSGFVCISAFSSLALEGSPPACSPLAAPVPGISPRAAPTARPWASSSRHPGARTASLQS